MIYLIFIVYISDEDCNVPEEEYSQGKIKVRFLYKFHFLMLLLLLILLLESFC